MATDTHDPLASAQDPVTTHVSSATMLTAWHLGMQPGELLRSSRLPLTIHSDRHALYQWLAREMADELKANQAQGRPTRWLLPVGPKDHYVALARICNDERISWRDVHAFHMDEWLDWQGRPVPEEHPFSFRGFCRRNLYDLLDPTLRPPADQVVYPTVYDIDAFSARIAEVGGLDTVFAGFGYRGHVAFNEPPATRWHHYSVDDLAASKTRVVPLLQDTIVAHSQRTTGGYTQAIPPMAVTVGMADVLAARRIRLITDGGAWKQYIVRVLLLTTEPDVNFPVTLCGMHENVDVHVDTASAAPITLGY